MAEEPALRVPPTTPVQHIFPTLTPAQVARIAPHGSVRTIHRGEVLVQVGDQVVPFFVITAGQVEVVRLSGTTESLVTTHGPGQFTGEVNMLSGRRALVRFRVTEPGEVIVLDRERRTNCVIGAGEGGHHRVAHGLDDEAMILLHPV